jgi:hypothetical protein
MFSPKVCPWSFYAILVAIFLFQTFYQPAEGNNEFAKIVNAFIGKVEKLKDQHSQQQQETHVVNDVVEVQHALLQIFFSDCDKLHQFSLEYKIFLESAKTHYDTAADIKECDYYIPMLKVGLSDILGNNLP